MDFLVGVDPVDDDRPTLEDLVKSGQLVLAPGVELPPETPWDPRLKWLLRAAREVPVEDLIERHEMVETIVERHGGFYDGGESGWLDTRTGEPVRQAES